MGDDPDPFDTKDQTKIESKLYSMLRYMSKSSLLIFHEKWKLRRFLLTLVLPTENLVLKEQALLSSKELGIKDLNNSYHIKDLQIVEGKVLTDEKHIRYSRYFEL